MSRYAIQLNGELVKHVVFEASNTNYPDSNVVVIAYDSIQEVQELLKIWPGSSIFDLKNNLHIAYESAIIDNVQSNIN